MDRLYAITYITIQTSELLGVYWEDDKKKHLAPNIKALISRFNIVSFWVTSMILKTQKLEDRATVIKHLITVAEHLRYKITTTNNTQFMAVACACLWY